MLFAGIDVGSTTSKCILLRDGEIVGSALVDMGIGTAGPEEAYSQTLTAAGAGPGKRTAAPDTGTALTVSAEGHLIPCRCCVISCAGASPLSSMSAASTP